MEQRKESLLNAIIREHIVTGDAVGSKVVVDKYHFGFSPATIRNEMNELEKEGYILQPHTSAGRIPTEKGWRFYVDNFVKNRELTPRERQVLEQASAAKDSYEQLLKNVARALADLSRSAVVVGFEPENVYYTGLSNLFHQPEFSKLDLVYHISHVVDHLDAVMEKIFRDIPNEIQVLVGSENPFGKECGSVVTKYWVKSGQQGMFGILGPMRMDYEMNASLLQYAKGMLASLRL